jgi:hypothetical protein
MAEREPCGRSVARPHGFDLPQRFFLPFLTSQESLPGVQFNMLARSMNSSLEMSPRAKRSARIFLASLSGEPLLATDVGPN